MATILNLYAYMWIWLLQQHDFVSYSPLLVELAALAEGYLPMWIYFE